MNKYQEHQEALDILKDIEQSHNLKKIGSSLTPESDLLQELVDEKLAKPTEEEIKKEWEEKGWKITIYNREIEIENNKGISTIYIDKKDKMFWSTHYLPVDLIQLLTKTFKWLGWDKENNNDK